MVKIRLMRIGSRKRPFYRIVAINEQRQRNGAYLELIGTYNPLTEPKDIKLDQNKLDAWVKKGAVLSDGVLKMLGKAPQKPPRKPKKEPATQPQSAPEQVAVTSNEESAPTEKNSIEAEAEAVVENTEE